MPTYKISYTKSANKEIIKLQLKDKKRISKAIYKLANNPRTGNVRPMVGVNAWRLRVGDFRVIYDIIDNELLILIIKIGPRKNVYRKE